MGWQRYLAETLLLLAAAQSADVRAASAVLYQPEQDTARVPQQPFFRFFTGDRFERRIVFYLSEEPEPAEPMPLVAFIQGSGATSLFVTEGDAVRGRHGFGAVADVLRGKARLIVVEKPGVSYLDDPEDAGGATDSSRAFRREHTLERWVEAAHAALSAARKLPEVRAGKVLVIGHSEGGLVAARLAADHEWVSHVAVLDAWDEISTDPFLRWSSFFSDSPMDALIETDARIYIAQGSVDRAVSPASFDALQAHLLINHADVTADRVEGADHSFTLEGRDGWHELMTRIAGWFLGPD